jgi:hypothetical protein
VLRDYPPGDFPSTVPETLMSNDTAAFLQRRQHRQARHTAKRQAQRRARRRAAAACPSRGQAVLCELCKTSTLAILSV